jgi:hypothetical protein
MSKLFDAINFNNINIIKSLINNNEVDINEVDNFGNTPLILAIYKKRTEIAKLLISNNANTEIKNKHGQNAIFYSVLTNSIELFTLLIKSKNVDLNVKDEFGRTLFSLAEKNNNTIILKTIKSYVNDSPTDTSINNSSATKQFFNNYEIDKIENYQPNSERQLENLNHNQNIDNSIYKSHKNPIVSEPIKADLNKPSETKNFTETTNLPLNESINHFQNIDNITQYPNNKPETIINYTVFESQNNENLNPNQIIINDNIKLKTSDDNTTNPADDKINDTIIEINNTQPQNLNANNTQSDIESTSTNDPQKSLSIEGLNIFSPLKTDEKIIDNNSDYMINLNNQTTVLNESSTLLATEFSTDDEQKYKNDIKSFIYSNIVIIVFVIGITLFLSFLKFSFWPSPTPSDTAKEYAKGINYYYEHNDYKKAVECFENASAQGHVNAQQALGLMYYKGEGVHQNNKKAFEWSEKAAIQGNAVAQYILGLIYYHGDGVPKDYMKAFEWHEKAAIQGNADAQQALGHMYFKGDGVPKDYMKAFEWHEKAAIQGNVDAQSRVGFMYYYGDGVTKDSEKAIGWLEKAAMQGHAVAQGMLGASYCEGVVVPRDFVMAYAYFNLSDCAVDDRDQLQKQLTSEQIKKGQEISRELFKNIEKNKKAKALSESAKMIK